MTFWRHHSGRALVTAATWLIVAMMSIGLLAVLTTSAGTRKWRIHRGPEDVHVWQVHAGNRYIP